MKKRWIITVLGVIFAAVYVLGYYSARSDHVLVRRVNPTYSEEGLTHNTYIIRGNFGPGKGGILVSPLEIDLCYYAFTPLRLLEAKYRDMTSSNQRLVHTGDPQTGPQPAQP